MKVVFRTDASLQIGNGHVMRCLTLADSLKAGGAECHFICREHPGNLIELISERGFAVRTLPVYSESAFFNNHIDVEKPNYAAWLGSDWITDAEQTKICAGGMLADWLIVDHYALGAGWEQAVLPICRKLMVIDDLADRKHDCDLLLDQNLGRNASDYDELVPRDCTVLAGPSYALLRPEFAALREYSLQRRAVPKLEHLLISMGGVDHADATGKLLEVLKDGCLPKNCHITVVMGQHAPWLERVQDLAAQMPQRTEVKVNVQNMAELMADCDLAIGAAGITSWERCCLGLPSLIVVLAENQRNGAAALKQSQCAAVVDYSDVMPKKISSILRYVVSPKKLTQLTKASCSITDGHGVRRVKRALGECNGR